MSELPSKSNFFCTLDTAWPPKRVASLYRARGWEVRKCGWHAYELRGPSAELVVEAKAPVLMHGMVADVLSHADDLLAPLRAAGISSQAECYGQDGELLHEWTHPDEEHNTGAPKRRWFRFSLRTLLVMLTVLPVLLGLVAWRLERARHDQQVLTDLGPVDTISYDMPMSSPDWLKTIWVMDHFYRVDGVDFGPYPQTREESLKHLARLPRLEKVRIESDAITDDGLRHLLGIERIRILGVASPRLTDEGLLILGQMKQLQVLAVESPQLTAEGIERLKRDLPNCQITGFDMIDVLSE